jgi:hypothetical protein
MPQALKRGPTLEETIPSESKGCEEPVLFRVPCNIPCSSMWMPIFNEKAHPALDVSTNAILKIRKISEIAKFRFLPSECGKNSIEQGVKFDGQWK